MIREVIERNENGRGELNGREGEGENEGIYEENSVYAVSKIMWEIVVDRVPMRRNEMKRGGEEKEIEAVREEDEGIYEIIRSGVFGKNEKEGGRGKGKGKGGRKKIGIAELEQMIVEYLSSMKEGVREEDKTAAVDTGEVVDIEVKSEVEDE